MILEASSLVKRFDRMKSPAVNQVSFSLKSGQTLGILGESGSGKSTLAKLILRLIPSDGGKIYFKGREITGLKEKELCEYRRSVQIVFQDPFSSLNPRMPVSGLLKEPSCLKGEKNDAELDAKVGKLLAMVGLPDNFCPKYPHQLSGGECQRVCVARALSLEPSVLICDEPVSSLDTLSRARVLNLLLALQKERGVSILFITHDIQSAAHMSDEILVMKEGNVCERGPTDRIMKCPEHPYTRHLIEKSI